MNFLGHLYFSNNNLQLMADNLFGDFIKGKNLSAYPTKLQKAIHLHRKIDHYIDHHPAVLELMHKLHEDLPKISGVAVDLYFDHLLAKEWSTFHYKDLQQYAQEFYDSIDESNPYYSTNFYFILSKMKEENWLYNYQFLSGLDKACRGVSGRISFPNQLVNGMELFKTHEKEIEIAFWRYMKDACMEFGVVPVKSL